MLLTLSHSNLSLMFLLKSIRVVLLSWYSLALSAVCAFVENAQSAEAEPRWRKT
ncbi:hypothetical protein O9992_28040 [Vibrio lentus]|nr:hypothetical protein [Vibrio lentus]